jgi:predicted SAM-dependent methyltransferase
MKSGINLACGKRYIPSTSEFQWLNIDDGSMNPNEKFDIKANIFSFNVQKESVDEILLCHFMMYVTPEKAKKLLKKWFGWLKKGGKLIIETSDSKKLAQMILEDPTKIEQMFGYGDTAGHKWSWTTKTLTPLLYEAGFTLCEDKDGGFHNRPDRDLTIVATK